MSQIETSLTSKERFYLKIQKFIDWLFFIPVGFATIIWLRILRQHRFLHLKESRELYYRVTANKRPTMICANHLTMFDSIYIHYAFSGVLGYITSFRHFAWNVPAVETFKTTVFLKILTYLGKCIPIDRNGTPEHHKNILDKLKFLLESGESVMIFPEAGRSRTGLVEVENVAYGIGNILKELKDYQVVCVYMRGSTQNKHTPLPAHGDEIYFRAELIEPKTTSTGIRAARDISVQIITKLKEMENEYFALYPDRLPR